MKIFLPIIVVAIFTIAMLSSGLIIKRVGFTPTNNAFINGQISYQLILIVITVISLVVTYLINKENFISYFSMGQIDAVGDELKYFGINKGDSWVKTGLSLSFVITSVTALFMYFQLKNIDIDWTILRTGIFWILLFALINSFGEEMIFRLGIIVPLKGLLSTNTILIISAVIFGLAHINGMPTGIIGMTIAGVLGFILAKSVIETEGFFWAWLIHFLQDVVIIGSLFLMSNSHNIQVE